MFSVLSSCCYYVESNRRPIQVPQAPVFIVASKEAQETAAAAENGLDGGAEAAVSLVASRGGRRLPDRRGALSGGAGDLAVDAGLRGGALPDFCRAEQLRLPGKMRKPRKINKYSRINTIYNLIF